MPTSNATREWDILDDDSNRTRREDPKEKRRIQNRIAQRVYRDRMKARMSELQARLDRHERENDKQQQGLVNTGNDNIHSSTTIGIATASASTHPNSPLPSDVADDNSSPIRMSATQANTPQSLPTMQQNCCYDTRTDRLDASLLDPGEKFLNSPPTTDHPPMANALESRPLHHSSGFDGKPAPHDCVCGRHLSRGHLQQGLNNIARSLLYPPVYNRQYDGTQAHTNLADSSNTESQFLPCHSEHMDFGLDTVDVWKQSLRLPSDTPAGRDSINCLQICGHGPSTMDLGVMDNTPLSISTPDNSSFDPSSEPRREGFEGILEHVQDAGFESFDALVTAYYIDNFRDGSPLANAQRLSRNRRLPKVLMDLFDAANKWTAWERRGFHEEILKNSGSILISESYAARNSLLSKLSPMFDEQESLGQPYRIESINTMKRYLQNEVPNFWAFAMEMAAENTQSRARDHSNTALATTLLVNFSGCIPHNQLLRLIDCCL